MPAYVLMPPPSPQWAIAETLMWRALAQALLADDPVPAMMALESMARVVSDASERAIPHVRGASQEMVIEIGKAILETLAHLSAPEVVKRACMLGSDAEQLWAEHAAECRADANDEVGEIIARISGA